MEDRKTLNELLPELEELSTAELRKRIKKRPRGPRKRIFDPASVEKALLGRLVLNENLRDGLEKLKREDPERRLATVRKSMLSQMVELDERFPNFAEPSQFYAEQLQLCLLDPKRVLYVPPVLALGPPGVGKTAFARALADTLKLPFLYVPLAQVTSSFELAGMTSSWNGSRQGKVAEFLVEEQFCNGLMLLDEIGRLQRDSNSPADSSLYALLEKNDARNYRDMFLDQCFDASDILIFATANDLNNIPDALQSRLTVFDIPAPNSTQQVKIAGNVYRSLRRENRWGRRFDEQLPAHLSEMLVGNTPREMRRALMSSFGHAARRWQGAKHRISLTEVDLRHGLRRRPPSTTKRAPRIH